MTWSGRHVVILGMARQGTALARYLAVQGAIVTLSDMKSSEALAAEMTTLADALGPAARSIRYVLGGHPESLLNDCDMLCLSGGVPIDLPIVQQARRRGIMLSNDAQVFFSVCPAPIIGITGSAGKTTTTALTGEMLKLSFGDEPDGELPGAHALTHSTVNKTPHAAEHSAVRVWVGGNIGNPLIASVDDIQPTDRVVMELSSFQLELMTASPHLACVTNITPNHLDRHKTMENYIAAKQHILDFQHPGDWAVLGLDNDVTAQMITAGRRVVFSTHDEPVGDAAWLDAMENLRVRIGAISMDVSIGNRRELLLLGEHNVQNVLAAMAISALGGATPDAMRQVATTYRGVAHRLQFIDEIRGVRYYDDSIATAPERLVAALRCFAQPVVLLCGGRDKHLPWGDAVRMMAQRCRCVLLFGEMAKLVADEARTQQVAIDFTACDNLDQAVHEAAARARPGDVVLLSPGGTSFDAFKDFEERGDVFVRLVHAMEEPHSTTGGNA